MSEKEPEPNAMPKLPKDWRYESTQRRHIVRVPIAQWHAMRYARSMRDRDIVNELIAPEYGERTKECSYTTDSNYCTFILPRTDAFDTTFTHFLTYLIHTCRPYALPETHPLVAWARTMLHQLLSRLHT